MVVKELGRVYVLSAKYLEIVKYWCHVHGLHKSLGSAYYFVLQMKALHHQILFFNYPLCTNVTFGTLASHQPAKCISLSKQLPHIEPAVLCIKKANNKNTEDDD